MQSDELERLRKQAQLQPTDAGVRQELALELWSAGETCEARREFETVLNLDPDDAGLVGRAHLFLGDLCADQGEIDTAIDHFRKSLRLVPDHVSANHMLGVLLLEKGSRAEARKHWEAVVAARERGEVPELYQVTEARRLLASYPLEQGDA